MSKLNLNPDLFLGSQELNRFQKFLTDDGYVKALLQNSVSFGIVHNDIEDGNWTNFLAEQGISVGNLKVNAGIAIDSTGKFIVWPEAEFALTDNNTFYWIKVAHNYSVQELLDVSVDKNGNLTCAGGEFLTILRGLPNNPVKIYFPNATLNQGEYELVEVVDDENAVLAGSFLAESGIKMAVVGAFTPDVVIPTLSKYIYKYDSCTMTLVTESVLNTAPALADNEYFIARVKRNGSALTIEDKRSLNIYRSKADFELPLKQRFTIGVYPHAGYGHKS